MDKVKRYGGGLFLEKLCRALSLPGRPRLIRYNTNLIYDCGDQIVRLTPNTSRSKEEVERELHWMAYLGSHSDRMVKVLGSSRTGTQQIEFEDEHFTATRLERIEGQPVREAQWNEAHFEQLGALAGFLHRLGQAYDPPSGFELSEWDESPEACLAHNLPEDERGLPAANQKVFEYMAAMPRPTAYYGPIHYDIHAGNYLFTPDGRMVLFDFENSCQGHYINDIAVVLYYARLSRFSATDDGFDERFLAAFWKGYAAEYTVPESEIGHLYWLLLNRGLIVYGYLLKIWPGERDAEQDRYIEVTLSDIERCRRVLCL